MRRKRFENTSACLLLFIGATLSGAQGLAAEQGDALEIAPVASAPVADGFTIAAVGDLMYLRPMLVTIEKQSPRMLRILRDADVTFGNLETSVVDLTTFKGAPQAESGGTWMIAAPGVPSDIARMGFDIVSHANNHTNDWGAEGLLETIQRLDAAGLVHAGTGRTLAGARAPRYFDAAAGRIGLVAASSTFKPAARAGDPLGEAPGRPGVNALRTQRIGLVSEDDLAVIARLTQTKAGEPVRFEGVVFRAERNSGPALEISYEINAADANANLLAVRQAKQNSNFAVFSLHSHEPGNLSETPAEFAVALAHKAIDDGADMFIGHGPHQLRGVEIYKGKPIFYSLGNFAMMNNSLDVVPEDMYERYGLTPGSVTAPELLHASTAVRFADARFYESVIAVSRYVGGSLAEIRMYPLDLGHRALGAARGVPKLADANAGRHILERMKRLCAVLGTHVSIESGVGVIRIPASVTSTE